MAPFPENLTSDQRDAIQQEKFPAWVDPMLATLTEDYFDDEEWIYERKLDGVRSLVFCDADDMLLKSRNQKDQNDTYPELVEALNDTAAEPFVADGEIVAFEDNVTSFSRLQNRINISDPRQARNSGVKVYLYLFDIIHYAGYDLSSLELRTRKKILREAFSFEDPIRYVTHRNRDGTAFLSEACNKGWEGIIAKDSRSGYVHSRSKKWLKFKCSRRQELVIGGYTDPQGERIGFGALLLGYYRDGDLQYAGQVGTGFDDEQLKHLHDKLSGLERKTSPFAQEDIDTDGVHWVTPRLVAEVGFTEWTDSNKLRHPRFLGLRHDKEAENVKKEA